MLRGTSESSELQHVVLEYFRFVGLERRGCGMTLRCASSCSVLHLMSSRAALRGETLLKLCSVPEAVAPTGLLGPITASGLHRPHGSALHGHRRQILSLARQRIRPHAFNNDNKYQLISTNSSLACDMFPGVLRPKARRPSF